MTVRVIKCGGKARKMQDTMCWKKGVTCSGKDSNVAVKWVKFGGKGG